MEHYQKSSYNASLIIIHISKKITSSLLVVIFIIATKYTVICDIVLLKTDSLIFTNLFSSAIITFLGGLTWLLHVQDVGLEWTQTPALSGGHPSLGWAR